MKTPRVSEEQKLTVRCPRCGSAPGNPCMSGSSYSYRERSNGSAEVNITFPTKLDRAHSERRQTFLKTVPA